MHAETALDVLYRLGKNLKTATGVECIDDSLKGGFEPGEIYELVGEQAVGKTQILYGIAASFLRLQSGNAAWIDINGSFITRRFLQFLGDIPNEQACSDLLRRIYVAHAFDATDMVDYLQEILNKDSCIKLVLIDNIGSILTKSRDAYRASGNEPILSVLKSLNRCAREGLTLILTNHLITVKGELTPSLGIKWRKELICQRYLVGRDDKSCYFRVARAENEDFKTSEEEPLRFSIYSSGISDFDNFL